MSPAAIVVLVLWLLASALSLWTWLPAGVGPATALRATRPAKIAVLTTLVLVAAGCAVLAAVSAPVVGLWGWVAGLLGATVTVLGGGALTTSVLALASGSAPTTVRVQRDVLRGGAWIGALERLALLGTLVVSWPEGLAAIVAVKGLARYPELRTASSTGSGANERFIIGTFASLGWTAVIAWVLTRLL